MGIMIKKRFNYRLRPWKKRISINKRKLIAGQNQHKSKHDKRGQTKCRGRIDNLINGNKSNNRIILKTESGIGKAKGW
jgi:hypothetical protein